MCRKRPFDAVEVGLAVVSPYGVEEVVEDGDPDPAPPLAHRGDHLPLPGLRVVLLHAGDGVAAAPASHWKNRMI